MSAQPIETRVSVVETKFDGFNEVLDLKFKTVNDKLDSQNAMLKDHIDQHSKHEEKSSDRKWEIALVVFNCLVTAFLTYKVFAPSSINASQPAVTISSQR